jgi:hypothetical protein
MGRLFLRVARLFGEDSSLAAENSCHGGDRALYQGPTLSRRTCIDAFKIDFAIYGSTIRQLEHNRFWLSAIFFPAERIGLNALSPKSSRHLGAPVVLNEMQSHMTAID